MSGLRARTAGFIQTQRRRLATAKILEKDVAAGRQAQHHFAPFGLREVQSDGSLAAIERHEVSAPFAAMRTHRAAIFAAADAFHFDDLGAQVGQNHAGGGAGDNGAQVEDANTFEYRGQENEDSMGRSLAVARLIALAALRGLGVG